MISEVAILNVIEDKVDEFIDSFSKAQKIIKRMPGYISHKLHRCIEHPNKYILFVEWDNLSDHTEGFRKSLEYIEWKRLLHHFYHPFPTVEHYELIFKN